MCEESGPKPSHRHGSELTGIGMAGSAHQWSLVLAIIPHFVFAVFSD